MKKIIEKMTDKEIIDAENQLRVIANIIIDKVISMTPEERKLLDAKIKKEKKQI